MSSSVAMASPLSRKQQRQAKKRIPNLQQKEIKLEEVGSLSKEVKPQLNEDENSMPCPENSMPCAESQVMAQAKTNTELELERQLQNERSRTKKQDLALSKMEQALRYRQHAKEQPLSLRFTALNNIKTSQLRAEKNEIEVDLKASQDLLQAERLSSQKNISNEEEMQLFRDFCETKLDQQMNANIKLKAALDKSEQDLKASQDLLETERHHQQNIISEKDGDILRSCQAKLVEQMDINRQITSALNDTLQDLKNVHLQWQREKSSLTAKHEEACDQNKKLMEIITFHKRENKGGLTMLDRIQCPQDRPELQEFLNINFMGRLYGVTNSLEISHQKYQEALENLATSERGFTVKLYQANKDRERLAADKTKCENKLEAERCQWKTEKASLERLLLEKNASLVVDLACEKKDNRDLLAALKKAEQQTESLTIEWQQEKAEQQAKIHAMEFHREKAEQLGKSLFIELQQEKAEHQAKIHAMELQQENAEQQENIRAIEWQQEKSSLKAKQEKLYEDLYHNKLKHMTLLHIKKDEAALMFEDASLSRKALLQQKQENIEITRDLESTTDELEKKRLHIQELSSQLETSKAHCFAKLETQEKDHQNLIATLKKKSEDELEGQRVLWQQEKSSLLQEAEQIHQTVKEEEEKQQKYRQSQIPKRQRRRWYNLFSCSRVET
ncbi:uncharacterized protein AB9W97_003220 isoform 1-T10 [Spinachia spinachia]